MYDTAIDARQRLRAVGLRVTAPRVAVLEVLDAHPHISARTATRLVREQIGRVSTQAIYDVLAACTDAGLVRSIEPAGSAARYEARAGDNHHHLVCRVCEDVVDVDCVTGSRPCLTPSDDADYTVEAAEVVFWGLCPACRAGDEALPARDAVADITVYRKKGATDG